MIMYKPGCRRRMRLKRISMCWSVASVQVQPASLCSFVCLQTHSLPLDLVLLPRLVPGEPVDHGGFIGCDSADRVNIQTRPIARRGTPNDTVFSSTCTLNHPQATPMSELIHLTFARHGGVDIKLGYKLPSTPRGKAPILLWFHGGGESIQSDNSSPQDSYRARGHAPGPTCSTRPTSTGCVWSRPTTG